MNKSSKAGKTLLGLAALLCAWSGPAAGIDIWKVGTGDQNWESIGSLDGVTTADNVLIPATVNPASNALSDILRRGGEISSPQARENLTLLLIDNNLETSWRVTRERRPDGTSMVIDLGAILPINRIRFVGGEDAFLRAYELFVHDGDPAQLRNGRPVAYTNLVKTNLEQDEPEIDVEIPLQFVRFIRLISRSTQEFSLIEAEVFGDGFAPTGQFTSEVIDLGEPANFGRIQLPVRLDSLTHVVLQTRSGSVPDPLIYYRKSDLFVGEGRAQEPILPVGSPEAAEEYEDLLQADKGDIVDNLEEWSPWSAPYEDFNGDFLSPGNRQYVQFRLFFSSQDARLGAAVESFSFEHSSPALAAEAVSEISPATVVLGQPHTFDYYIRSEFGPDNPGFDRVQIQTPFRAALRSVELDGVAISFEEVEAEDELSLTVQLTGDRVATSGQTLRIAFDALVTVYGTTFFGKVFDSASGELGQDVVPGNASPGSASDRLSIQGELSNQLLLGLQTDPPVFTPNGDGANDDLAISYILLRALNPVAVELILYDLAGNPVHQLQQIDALNGPQVVTWEGRDASGQLVPPGLYLLGLTVDTDTGSETRTRIVGVAY